MSEEDTTDDDRRLEERMRARLGVHEPKREELIASAKAEKEPRPVKVLVERVREWGELGHERANAVHWRYFLYSVNEGGARKQILNTTSEAFAKRETEKYQKQGIPVEVLKEHTI